MNKIKLSLITIILIVISSSLVFANDFYINGENPTLILNGSHSSDVNWKIGSISNFNSQYNIGYSVGGNEESIFNAWKYTTGVYYSFGTTNHPYWTDIYFNTTYGTMTLENNAFLTNSASGISFEKKNIHQSVPIPTGYVRGVLYNANKPINKNLYSGMINFYITDLTENHERGGIVISTLNDGLREDRLILDGDIISLVDYPNCDIQTGINGELECAEKDTEDLLTLRLRVDELERRVRVLEKMIHSINPSSKP